MLPKSVLVTENSADKGEKNKARAEILYYDGSWHTEVGDAVKPDNASKWWHAQVYAELPPSTTQVKVRIRGYPYGGEPLRRPCPCPLSSSQRCIS